MFSWSILILLSSVVLIASELLFTVGPSLNAFRVLRVSHGGVEEDFHLHRRGIHAGFDP
jgi:hypothetical protein